MPPDRQSPFYFEGFETPNGTIVPDQFFIEVAPNLTEAELRVCLYLIFKTFGFRKHDGDAISVSQMVAGTRRRDGHHYDNGTGLARSAVQRAVKGLSEKGVVEVERRRSELGDYESNFYRLRFRRGVALQKGYGSPAGGPGGPQGGHPVALQKGPHETTLHETNSSSPTPSSRTERPANAGTSRRKKSDDASQLSKKRVGEISAREAAPEALEARPSLDLITALTAQGVSRSMAKRLVEEYPRHLIEQELQLLPHRKGVKDSAAYLVRAIRAGDFLPPADLEAARRREEAQVNAKAAEAKREAERQAAERARQQRIEAVLVELPAVDRADLEERARAKMAKISKRAADDPRIVRAAVFNLVEAEYLQGAR